jgi:hypothetical protein
LGVYAAALVPFAVVVGQTERLPLPTWLTIGGLGVAQAGTGCSAVGRGPAGVLSRAAGLRRGTLVGHPDPDAHRTVPVPWRSRPRHRGQKGVRTPPAAHSRPCDCGGLHRAACGCARRRHGRPEPDGAGDDSGNVRLLLVLGSYSSRCPIGRLRSSRWRAVDAPMATVRCWTFGSVFEPGANGGVGQPSLQARCESPVRTASLVPRSAPSARKREQAFRWRSSSSLKRRRLNSRVRGSNRRGSAAPPPSSPGPVRTCRRNPGPVSFASATARFEVSDLRRGRPKSPYKQSLRRRPWTDASKSGRSTQE